jgi:hypothetical protein
MNVEKAIPEKVNTLKDEFACINNNLKESAAG